MYQQERETILDIIKAEKEKFIFWLREALKADSKDNDNSLINYLLKSKRDTMSMYEKGKMELQNLKASEAYYRTEFEKVYASTSLRVGQKVTAIPRKIKNLLKK